MKDVKEFEEVREFEGVRSKRGEIGKKKGPQMVMVITLVVVEAVWSLLCELGKRVAER